MIQCKILSARFTREKVYTLTLTISSENRSNSDSNYSMPLLTDNSELLRSEFPTTRRGTYGSFDGDSGFEFVDPQHYSSGASFKQAPIIISDGE